MTTIQRTARILFLGLAILASTAFSATGQTVPTNPNMPSKVSYLVIGVTDLSKSIEFYNGILGLTVLSRDKEIARLSASNVILLLSETLGKKVKPATGSMQIVFPVANISTSIRLLKEKGCEFLGEPQPAERDSFAAIFKDPDGHLLTIMGQK